MRSSLKRLSRPAKKPPAARPAQIDRLRESYVAMICTARKFNSEPNAFLDKAHSLLTTHWAHATWASRTTILKSVDWLLQVGINHSPVDGRRALTRRPNF